jgi:hypothetical protein
MLVGRFLDDFLETVDRWAEWAGAAIGSWPDHPSDATFDPEAQAATVRQSLERAERWRAASRGAPPLTRSGRGQRR